MAVNHAPARLAPRVLPSRRAAFLAALVAFAPLPALPEEAPAAISADSGDWYYTVDENGVPVFTQVLSWSGDEHARSYEVEVQNMKGKTVMSESTASPRLEVSLPAGEYRYRVAVMNLLGKREVEGEWVGFTVKKAIDPQIDWITPNDFFFDTGEMTLLIGGARFDKDVAVFLVGEGSDEVAGEIREATKGRITVVFLPGVLASGTYQVKVVNKSGLFALSAERLRVSSESPYQYYVSAGYMPFVALLDPWFTEIWSDAVFPAGGVVRAGAMFVKKSDWRLGAELRLSGRSMKGGDSGVGAEANVFQAGLGVAYARAVGGRLGWIARAGGGLSVTSVSYSLGGTKVREAGSFDPSCYAGLALRYRFGENVFAELAADCEMTFYKDFVAGGVAPSFSAGYLW